MAVYTVPSTSNTGRLRRKGARKGEFLSWIKMQPMFICGAKKKSHLVLSKQQQNSLTWKLRQQIDLESRSNVGDSPNRHLGEGRKPRTPISSSIQNVNHPSFIRILYILSISFEGEWTQKLGSFSILGPVFRAHFQTLGINQ